MEFSFEDHGYKKLLDRAGITGTGVKIQFSKILIPFAICWLPLAITTLIQGTFWTGNIKDSFITNFDTQARLLISMPILILAERIVSSRLSLILGHFKNAGIINKADYQSFDNLIERNVRLLKSNWTDLAVFLICYVHVFLVIFYESQNTSILSWQTTITDGESVLNFAGKWSVFISRPFLLFLFYRWLLLILVWGITLRKISKFKLNLFAVHPDLSGGLGFIGYAMRYFSPIAFAISATVAGYMADFILIEGYQLDDLKITALGYFIFITLLFTFPLLSFSRNLVDAREKSVFENDAFANGVFRELRVKFSKGYDKVSAEDLKLNDYSAAADLSAAITNALKMKTIPFTLKDLVPLWVMTGLPFLAVLVMQIPVNEILNELISFLV